MQLNLMHDVVRSELVDIVGHEDVTTQDADRLAYAFDCYLVSQVWADRGQMPPRPDYIVSPETVSEVARIVRLANRHKIPVIPYGGGTGTQGGTVPLFGGIILDLKKLNRLIRIDEESLTVTAQAGVHGQTLERECNKRGLTLAHYPASQFGATVGGYVAARGSGTLSTKYGKAEDMVLSLEIVLPNGEVMRTLPVPSHACGPGLLPLFIGSEGTLGIITEVTMRLDPIPQERRFRAYLFENLRSGLEAGRRMMTKRLRPCAIRLYDPNSTQKLLRNVLGVERHGGYMIVGADGDANAVEREMRAIDDICRDLGAEDLGAGAGDHWWKHRYDFYFPPFTLGLPVLFGTVESTTTFDRIHDLYLAKKECIEQGYADWGVEYIAHFSHWFPWGVMIYDRFIIRRPPQDPREAIELHSMIWGDAARCSLANGGTLNDHHGIGFKLGWLMPEQYGNAWPVMQAIKSQLDPLGIMNPGKLGFRRT